jgi:hypothetical protein
MFFAVKDTKYSQRDRRRQDRMETMEMEERLKRDMERKREEEMRAATEQLLPRYSFLM